MLVGSGGHEGAAGLSIEIEKIGMFRRALSQHISSLTVQSAEPALIIDANLPLTDANADFVRLLNKLAPFGEGNPAPVFCAQGVVIHRAEFLDRAHEHRRLTVYDPDGETFFVYWWGSGDQDVPQGATLDLAYTISLKPGGIVTYTLVDYEVRAQAAPPAPTRDIIDLRQASILTALRYAREQFPDLAVWVGAAGADGLTLHELPPGSPLGIYSIPPSQSILSQTIERLTPPAVILFGVEPAPLRWDAVIKVMRAELSQMNSDPFELLPFALRFGLTEAAAQHALDILTAMGAFPPFTVKKSVVQFGEGTPAQDLERVKALLPRFNQMLSEIEAWRAFYRTAKVESLF
jgi:hypothetical protein